MLKLYSYFCDMLNNYSFFNLHNQLDHLLTHIQAHHTSPYILMRLFTSKISFSQIFATFYIIFDNNDFYV